MPSRRDFVAAALALLLSQAAPARAADSITIGLASPGPLAEPV